ncbi:serine/threonine-protein kinase CBK1 [Cryptosporidium felis]|nr:serine/threonine-protein kinase CBK1 [Cryptosporidium felis]
MVLEKRTCSVSRSSTDSRKSHSKISTLASSRNYSSSTEKKSVTPRPGIPESLAFETSVTSKQRIGLPKRPTPKNEPVRSLSEVEMKPPKEENQKFGPVSSGSRTEVIVDSESRYCCSCRQKILQADEAVDPTLEYHRGIFSSRESVTLEDFHTVSIIGQGGYSIVRLVFDIQTGHVYALKQAKKSQIMTRRISRENLENLNEIDINSPKKSRGDRQKLDTAIMLNTEIALMYNSNSPWINKLYHYWEDSHFYFMLMEYMPGGDLMRHLIELHTFDEETAKFYIAEILLALEYLNNVQGHIHRDIKPDNILLDKNGHIKLIDFGLSKQIIQEKQRPFVSNVALSLRSQKKNNKKVEPQEILVHDSNFHAGTPDYMAPEIHRGEPYSLCVDLWSVGIILFEMLFGGPPLSDPGQNSLITRNKVMNWGKYFFLPSEHHKYSSDAMDLICSLVCEPSQRIKSAKDAMKHPFFKGVDFSKIRLQKPPIVPIVKHKLDCSNFDKFPDEVLVSFYNSVRPQVVSQAPNFQEEFIANSCNSKRPLGEVLGGEFFPTPPVSGLHKNNSLNILESATISSSGTPRLPICTPNRSFLPLVTQLGSPASNSTTASSSCSSWKHLSSSPIFQTPRKPSSLSTASTPQIPPNRVKNLSQSYSYLPILNNPLPNFSNSLSGAPLVPLTLSMPINSFSEKTSSTPNRQNSTPNLARQPNAGHSLGNTTARFSTFKERKSSEDAFNRISQKNPVLPLRTQRSTSSTITRNNQGIINLLRKKNII